MDQPATRNPKLFGQLPTMVKSEVMALPDSQRSAFFEEYTRRRKVTVLGYVAWLILGSHYAYIGGRWLVQVVFWLSSLSIVIGAVWWLIDLFRIPMMVRNHNRDVAIAVIQELQRVTPGQRPPQASPLPPGTPPAAGPSSTVTHL